MPDAQTTTADTLPRLPKRYEVVECIGEGLSGRVYRALQWPLKRSVAVKVLSRERATEPKHVERFINEARILANLRHPHTVGLIELGRTEAGRPFLAMEHVGGGTLRDLMVGRRVEPRLALQIAQQVASALAEAHDRGIIHRDLKPENVLLETVGGGELVARLIDFGLADEESDESAVDPSAPRVRAGTPGYMSPEQIFFQPVDVTTDVYALGALLYEMLTGHAVFESDTRQGLYLEHRYSLPPMFFEIAPDLDVDTEVEDLVRQLLAKSPEDRPSAAEAAEGLRAFAADAAPAPQRTTPAPPRPAKAVADVVAPKAWYANHHLATGALLGGLVVSLVTFFFGG